MFYIFLFFIFKTAITADNLFDLVKITERETESFKVLFIYFSRNKEKYMNKNDGKIKKKTIKNKLRLNVLKKMM